MGSLCSLDTTEPTATIREKNSLPTQVKTVSDFEYGTYGASTSASIGDTVYFKIEVTDGIGTDGELIVHDVMSSGLTLDPESIVIEAEKYVLNSKTGRYDYQFMVVDSTNYTIKLKQDLIAEGDNTTQSPSDNCTFEIVFNADFIAGLGDSRHIRISYEATVNENAVIAGTGNPNTSKVEYSHQMTPESTAIVYTYAGAIYKFDGVTGAELAGATFAVTADPNETSSGGFENMTFAPPSNETENPVMTPEPKRGPLNGAISAPVPLRQISAGDANSPAVYRYDPSSNSNTIVTPASGAVVLLGFAEGTVLTLTETAAPTGYNLLAAPVTITINATHVDTVDKSYTIGTGADAVTVTFEATDYDNDHNMTASGDDAEKQIHADSIVFVQNNTGTELPSTGGIGTTIFIIAGSVLVLGAGIILVAMSVSKRRAEEE
jgi:fimbrial isopeptide formation D2 family protein/LPXTG-motif cell wall-anchored protein